MWLIMLGEQAQGGSVRRTLPATATHDEIVEAMRAVAGDFYSCDWLRADLWEVGGTEPVRRIRAQDVGIEPVEPTEHQFED
jgi:hypothetical protein